MRSFWIRIFATFWIIEILTVAAVVTMRGSLEDFTLHPLSEKALTSMAFSAEEVYQAGQCNELTPLLSRFKRVYKVTPHLFDDTGHAVCGDVVSQAVQRAADGSQSFGFKRVVEIMRGFTPGRNGQIVASVRLNPGQNTPFRFVVETAQIPSWSFRFRGEMIVFAAILFSGLLSALLARILVRPIGQLRHTAQELASGNLQARAGSSKRHSSKGDEVVALVHDFNRMADQIESLLGMQKQLIRDVSHELRSPLSRLSVALELLREDTNEQSMVHVERIERETERLNRLIGQLLELSRMEATEGVGIRTESVQLEEIVREVVSNAAYEAGSRGCNVRAVLRDQVTLQANPELLASAIENVVRNGIRYTHAGTDVMVTLEYDRNDGATVVKLTVRDFGPGVPEDKIPSLRMPFYRLDPARSSETGGTGVGLAIADRAIRLHGGSLALRNHPEGGLEVILLLPAVQPVSNEAIEVIAVTTG
jgi:two-component system sensor histidine kinase CpxA